MQRAVLDTCVLLPVVPGFVDSIAGFASDGDPGTDAG
jgi:hypothetical protein